MDSNLFAYFAIETNQISVMTLTLKDFRSQMASSFDRADAGERVLIRRRRQLYAIVPVKEDESEITPALAKKIAKARKDMVEGKCVSLRTHEEIGKFFDSL